MYLLFVVMQGSNPTGFRSEIGMLVMIQPLAGLMVEGKSLMLLSLHCFSWKMGGIKALNSQGSCEGYLCENTCKT